MHRSKRIYYALAIFTYLEPINQMKIRVFFKCILICNNSGCEQVYMGKQQLLSRENAAQILQQLHGYKWAHSVGLNNSRYILGS